MPLIFFLFLISKKNALKVKKKSTRVQVPFNDFKKPRIYIGIGLYWILAIETKRKHSWNGFGCKHFSSGGPKAWNLYEESKQICMQTWISIDKNNVEQ